MIFGLQRKETPSTLQQRARVSVQQEMGKTPPWQAASKRSAPAAEQPLFSLHTRDETPPWSTTRVWAAGRSLGVSSYHPYSDRRRTAEN